MRYHATHISDTELDALATAVRNGSYIPRTRDHKITTLMALARRDWVTLNRVTRVRRDGHRITSVAGATITHAGRVAHQQFTGQRAADTARQARIAKAGSRAGAIPTRLANTIAVTPARPRKTAAPAVNPSPRIAHADPFDLLGTPATTGIDWLDD